MIIFLSILAGALVLMCIFLLIKLYNIEKGVLNIIGPQLDAHEKALQLLAKKLGIS